MEFIDGEDLSQRIARGGPIPLDEALPLALQIAEAMEGAHGQGIIHRDLKPANIKVTADGTVKVLDFGLAKALAPPDTKAGPAGALENSPTITSPFQMSQLGVILGTAAYMAPEQAKGKPVDKRADIWAFGCVLYEMLTGTRPFGGEDVTDTLAAIVRADPDWSALPPDTPLAIRTLLRRCLEKERRDRLPDIGAARLELKEARATPAAPVAARGAPAGRARLVSRLAIGTVAALAAAALGFQFARSRETPRDERVVKSMIVPPAGLSGAPALRLQISPDGRKLAFIAPAESGRTMLWVRALDSVTAQPLAGTINAAAPFWSPDSRWLASMADGKLKKVEASGGPVITLCDAAISPPGAWSKDDVIIFSGRGGLVQVPATGGTPVPVTAVDTGRGERAHISPFFLSDSRHFLFTAGTDGMIPRGVFVGSLDSKVTTQILEGSTNAAYANGHLIFMRGSTLMAQPFDEVGLSLRGQAMPIAEDVQVNPSTGTGAFSVSQNGVLVYQTGPSAGTQLAWIDRAGKRLVTVGESALYRDLQLSPDGRFVSATIASTTSAEGDVWLIDIERKLPRRWTFGAGGFAAVWSPDGRSLVYSSRRGRMADLFRKSAAGTGSEETLLQDDREKVPLQIAADQATLLYFTPTGAATGKLHTLELTGERRSAPLMETPNSQVPAAISPDGRWLAYVSDETGRREVYVTSFPNAVGKWQVSSDGGETPKWNATGKELFFIAIDKLMAVQVTTTASGFNAGPERALFDVRVPAPALGTRSTYAVSRDGQRFLFNTWDAGAALTPITLVVNWEQALRK